MEQHVSTERTLSDCSTICFGPECNTCMRVSTCDLCAQTQRTMTALRPSFLHRDGQIYSWCGEIIGGFSGGDNAAASLLDSVITPWAVFGGVGVGGVSQGRAVSCSCTVSVSVCVPVSVTVCLPTSVCLSACCVYKPKWQSGRDVKFHSRVCSRCSSTEKATITTPQYWREWCQLHTNKWLPLHPHPPSPPWIGHISHWQSVWQSDLASSSYKTHTHQQWACVVPLPKLFLTLHSVNRHIHSCLQWNIKHYK